MDLRRSILAMCSTVCLVLTLCVPASAATKSDSQASESGRLLGSITLTADAAPNPQAVTASISGRSVTIQLPQDLLVEVVIRDGAGYVAARNINEATTFFVKPASVASQAGPATCLYWSEGSGYHYAQWAIGDEEHLSTSVVINSGSSQIIAITDSDQGTELTARFLADYVKSDSEKDSWHRIAYCDSVVRLEELVGKKAAIRLNLILHRDLGGSIRIGDPVPGILVSPDGKEALALFFHRDGTLTRAYLKALKNETWAVETIEEISQGQ